MGIKFLKFGCFLLMISMIKIAAAKESIIIERYENWKNPIVNILKKYSIYLYKVKYSSNGKISTLYVKFKYDPQVGSRGSEATDHVYEELLEANSNFSYALIDVENGVRIDVRENKNLSRVETKICGPDSTSSCDLR